MASLSLFRVVIMQMVEEPSLPLDLSDAIVTSLLVNLKLWVYTPVEVQLQLMEVIEKVCWFYPVLSSQQVTRYDKM